MDSFKKQRIVGDGISGADIMSHVGAANPHPQYARLDQVVSGGDLGAHLSDTNPHSEYVVQKNEIITDYMLEENANKVVAASVIKTLGNKLLALENNFEIVPSGYSAYKIEGYNTILLGNSAYLESSVFRANRHKLMQWDDGNGGTEYDKGYYILNGEMYDNLGKKYTLNHLAIESSLWTDIAMDLCHNTLWSGMNNGMVFFQYALYLLTRYSKTSELGQLFHQLRNSEFSQVRFGEFNNENIFTANSIYDTIWKYAKLFVSTTYTFDHHPSPILFLGSTETEVYVSVVCSAVPSKDTHTIQTIRAMTSVRDNKILPSPIPTKVYYKNTSNEMIQLPSAKQLISALYGSACFILTNNNVLYTLEIIEIGKPQPVATKLLENVTRVIEGYDYLIIETYKQNVYKLYKLKYELVELHSSVIPYTSISTELYFTSSFYFILSGELYKVDKDAVVTKLNNTTYNLKNIWSSVVVGQYKIIGKDSSNRDIYAPTAYAVNDGDIYYIDDLVPHKVTTTKDWYKVDGGDSLVVAIKKNSGITSHDDGVLYKHEILQAYNAQANNTTLSAALVSQFREEYNVHSHDGLYTPISHLSDYGNPHPQYITTLGLANSGVYVRDPFENCVPVYKMGEGIVDQETLDVSLADEYASLTIVNNNATGLSRSWTGQLDSSYAHSAKICVATMLSDGNYQVQYETVVGTDSPIIGSEDKNSGCPFYIKNKELYVVTGKLNTSIVEHVKISDPEPATTGWTNVVGFAGVFNGKLYNVNGNRILDSSGEVVEGTWTSLTKYYNIDAMAGICNGLLYVIIDNYSYRITSDIYDLTKCTVCYYYSVTATMGGTHSHNVYVISNGIAYGIRFTNNLNNFILSKIDTTITDWISISNSYNSAYQLLRADRTLYMGQPNSMVSKMPNPNALPPTSGWTALSGSFGIYNGQLWYIHYGNNSLTYTQIAINGNYSNKWTDIGVNYGHMPGYSVGVCDNKVYRLTATIATLLLDSDIPIQSICGMLQNFVPGGSSSSMIYRVPFIVSSNISATLSISASFPEYPYKWVIYKTIGDQNEILSVATTTHGDPWNVEWTTPNTSVNVFSTDGFWSAVDMRSLMQDATASIRGITKPLPGGGLEITQGDLKVAPEVAKLHQLTTNTIPIYGYETQNDDIIVTAGLSTIPLLSKVEPLDIDVARVWKNYTEHGPNKLGIITNTALTIIPTTEPVVTLEESDNSCIGCNYTVVNGKLFYIAKPIATEPVVIQRVGTDTTWTKVSGMYQDLGSGNFTYAYGINNEKLYKIAGTATTVLHASSSGWDNVCGYSSNKTPNFYAYGIKNNQLFYIANETVSSVTGKTGTWLAISGIGGTYAGQPTTAYGIVFSNNVAEICKLGTTAVIVPNSGTGWSQITGYTYLDSIAYGIRDTYLLKITPDGVVSINSIPGWTKISGLGYTNSGCAYGLLNEQVYAIKNTTLELVGADTGWTDITGDYSGAFKRYGYGINRGRLYSLRDTNMVQLTKDTGWTKIFGRSDTLDYVVCGKLDEESYEVSADVASGKWRLRKYTSPSYQDVAVSYEPASGTNPWDCTWDNSVIVLDVVSHSEWTGIPITEFPTIGVMNNLFIEYFSTIESIFHKIEDFNTVIAEYVRLDELLDSSIALPEELILDNYVRKEYVDNVFDPHITESVLDTNLLEYVKLTKLLDSSIALPEELILDNYVRKEYVGSVLDPHITTSVLNAALSDYSPTTELQDYMAANYVTYAALPSLGGGTGDVTWSALLTNDGIIKQEFLLDYVEKVYNQQGVEDPHVTQTTLDAAKVETIPAIQLADNGTRVIHPSRFYYWKVYLANSVLQAGATFSSTGLEYSYLEITVESGGSIQGDGIVLTNELTVGMVNVVIVRNMRGTIRMTVVDTYVPV